MAFNCLDLQSQDQAVFNHAWAAFSHYPELVSKFLAEAPLELVHATLAAGLTWTGTGWNTTRASKELQKITGVCLVTSKWAEYCQCFLFSLALSMDIEVDNLDLSEKAGEAAFTLATVWSSTRSRTRTTTKLRTTNAEKPASAEEDDEEADGEEQGGERLPWQEEPAPLAP